MRITITRKVLIIITIPLVFQGIFVGLLASSQQDHAEALERSFHSRDVVAETNQVLRYMVDAETGMRGYIVTDDKKFTEPYDRAREEFPVRLRHLQDLVKGDPEEAEQVRRIDAAANEVLDWHEKTEEMMRNGQQNLAIERTKGGRGKVLMDELRHHIALLLAKEKRVGDERTAGLKRSRQWIRALLVGGTLTTLALTVTLTAFFWRQIGKRFAFLTVNTKRLAAGQELLPPLDGGDEIAQLDLAFHDMANQMTVAAENLRRTSKEVRDLYNRAPCGYQSLADDGAIVEINETELQWLQYARAEVVGRMKFPDLLTEPSRQRFNDTFRRFKERGWINNVECELVRRDGSILPVLLNAVAIRDDAGRYVSSRATLFDMSERKQAEEEIRKSTERFQLLVENATDYALIMLDAAGRVVSWNASAERINGYRADEIIGKHFSCFYPQEAIASGWPEQELQYAIAQGRFEDEGTRVRKNGSQFWANVVITARRNAAGEIEGFSKITRDLTERKRAEEEIRIMNRELEDRVRQRTSELEDANRELTQKNQENEMFVYSVSHDLRSPLVNLQGFSKEIGKECDFLTKLLADDRLPAEIREQAQALLAGKMAKSLGFIQTAVLRLSTIIDALLRLSRAGRVDYRWQRVDANQIVAQIVASLHGTIAEKKATVQKSELPAVWGDPTALEQVFANLIGNALNYLDPKRPGIVEIGCRKSAGDDSSREFITFYVKDNGLGIPAAQQKKVFQVFQRAHPGAAKGEGIGLAIVARVVERHRGRLWVESQDGAGSTFFVSLPSSGQDGFSK